jgi:hypothetical protein
MWTCGSGEARASSWSGMSCPSARRPAAASPRRRVSRPPRRCAARPGRRRCWPGPGSCAREPRPPCRRTGSATARASARSCSAPGRSPAPVRGILEVAEHEHGLAHPSDLGQRLVPAVLARVRAEPVQDERGRSSTRRATRSARRARARAGRCAGAPNTSRRSEDPAGSTGVWSSRTAPDQSPMESALAHLSRARCPQGPGAS